MFTSIKETDCFCLRNKLFPKEKQVISIIETRVKQYLNNRKIYQMDVNKFQFYE